MSTARFNTAHQSEQDVAPMVIATDDAIPTYNSSADPLQPPRIPDGQQQFFSRNHTIANGVSTEIRTRTDVQRSIAMYATPAMGGGYRPVFFAECTITISQQKISYTCDRAPQIEYTENSYVTSEPVYPNR